MITIDTSSEPSVRKIGIEPRAALVAVSKPVVTIDTGRKQTAVLAKKKTEIQVMNASDPIAVHIPGLVVGGGLDQETADDLYVNVDGDTMTGPLNVAWGSDNSPSIKASGYSELPDVRLGYWLDGTGWVTFDPIFPEHAATKAYVDAHAGGSGDAAWTFPTLLPNWANQGAPYMTPRLRKNSAGMVVCEGMVKFVQPSEWTSQWSPVFTLPVGYRPSAQLNFAQVGISASTAVNLQVLANGTVQVYIGPSNLTTGLNFTFYAEQ